MSARRFLNKVAVITGSTEGYKLVTILVFGKNKNFV